MNTKLKHLKLALLLGEDGECNLASPVAPIWTKSGLRKFIVFLYIQDSATKQKRTHCITARRGNAGALMKAHWKCLRVPKRNAIKSLTTRRVLSGECSENDDSPSDGVRGIEVRSLLHLLNGVPLCMWYHPESYVRRRSEEVWQSQKDERICHSPDKTR